MAVTQSATPAGIADRAVGQRIAVVGAGISGNTVANILSTQHEVHLFEASSQLGGHTHTVEFERFGNHYAVDTGFMVFNDRTYPNFIRMLEILDVPSRASDMSFSVRCERTGLEYCGSSFNSLFAQRRNLVRPQFYRMLLDILRFNSSATALARNGHSSQTLAEFLRQNQFGQGFIERYLRPMIASIWSACPAGVDDFPVAFLARFFDNHGLLQISNRPQWRTIVGGAHRYVERLLNPLRERVFAATPIESIRRSKEQVYVKPVSKSELAFDHVVVATHPDQALKLLQDPTPTEREVLGSFAYQDNLAVLHTDATYLPQSQRAWASWNYLVPKRQSEVATLTYNLNRLQGHVSPQPICVTLNPLRPIDDGQIIRNMEFRHPVFDQRTVTAQQRQDEVNGHHRTYFCGAYWRNGFHEDGVVSGLAVTKHFGLGIEDCKVASTAASFATNVASR